MPGTLRHVTQLLRRALCEALSASIVAVFVSLGTFPFGILGAEAQSEAHREGGNPRVEEAFTCSSSLSPKDSSTVLSKVQKAYRDIAGMRAEFIQQSTVAALDQSEVASGSVSFLKPGRMKWVYKAPESQIFLVRDSTVWFYQEQLRQVVIDDIGAALLSDLPVSFLMGIGELEKDFSLASACLAGKRILLELSPRKQGSGSKDGSTVGDNSVVSKDASLKSFTLLVDRTSYRPLGANVADVGGNTTSMVFFEPHYSAAGLSENSFAASFPDGIDISDRRVVREPVAMTERALIEPFAEASNEN